MCHVKLLRSILISLTLISLEVRNTYMSIMQHVTVYCVSLSCDISVYGYYNVYYLTTAFFLPAVFKLHICLHTKRSVELFCGLTSLSQFTK